MGRRPCCSKEGLNRGAWTAIEDKILVSYINTHGEGKWRDVPQRAGLKRCGKSCRLRWLNYLRPDIKRGNISHEEEELIIRLHNLLGNRWSLIAGRLPGRTDNEIKNYWNTTLGKKLFLGTGSISTQDQDQTQTQTQQDLNVALDQNPITQQIRITDSTSTVVRTKAIRCTKVVSCCTQLNEINNQLVQESDYKQGHAQGNGDNLVAVASDDHDDITEEIRGLSFDANSNSELSFDHEQILGDWMPMPMHMDLKALTSLLDFGEDWFNLTKLI